MRAPIPLDTWFFTSTVLQQQLKEKLLLYSGLLQAYLVPYLRKILDLVYDGHKNKLQNPPFYLGGHQDLEAQMLPV